MHTYIQTLREKRLAKRCRGRLHGSAQGRACLDIEASLEPRCRPTPLCRAFGRTCSDSTLRNSTTFIPFDQRRHRKPGHPECLTPSSRTVPPVIPNDPPHHPERPSVVYDGLGLIPRLLSFPPLFIIFSSNLIYLLSANIG